MSRIRIMVSLLAVVLLGLVGAAPAAGQEESPAASGSPAPTLKAELLGSGPLAALPGYEVSLRRTTLPPGVGIAPHTHPGSIVIYVDEGTWNYTPLAGRAVLSRAAVEGASPAPSEELAYNTEVVLNAGDWLYVEEPGDTVLNDGDEPVVLLIAAVAPIGVPFQTMTEMEMPSPSPAGS